MSFSGLVFEGNILGVAFSSGDRFAVGRWHTSPFGGFADIMWARPDDTRVLICDVEAAAAFIRRHYTFDERIGAHVTMERHDATVDVVGGPVQLTLELGDGGLADRLLRLRPPWLRGRPAWLAFEDRFLRPVVSPLLGDLASVRVTGVTRAGWREWYAPRTFEAARNAHGIVEGRVLGSLDPSPAPADFGFSEFPSRAGVVQVTSMFRGQG